MILSLCFLQNSSSCGTRAIEPSSFIISQITPAGFIPARSIKSTAPSVWPARVRTPPAAARSGNIWPGRTRSEAFALSAIAVLIVTARSAALMPVVVFSFASIETVKAVPRRAVFSAAWECRFSESHFSPVIGKHINPRPWVAIKLTISGVISSAAATKSPSSSLSSSSTRTIILPFLRSSRISGISLK